MFTKFCGDDAIKNVVLTTTMWRPNKKDSEELREQELRTEYWKGMVDKGCRIARFYKTFKSAWAVVDIIVGNEAHSLLIQEELVNLRQQLGETQAGLILYTKLEELLADRERLEGEARTRDDPQLVENQNNIRQILIGIEEARVFIGRRILSFFDFIKRVGLVSPILYYSPSDFISAYINAHRQMVFSHTCTKTQFLENSIRTMDCSVLKYLKYLFHEARTLKQLKTLPIPSKRTDPSQKLSDGDEMGMGEF